MNEQIKLAKLIGIKDWTELGTPMVPSYDGCAWEHYCQWNPEKSADDDCAVLEWMRTQSHPFVKNDYRYLDAVVEVIRSAETYEIGDYARAALKVIGDNKPAPPEGNTG